MKEIKKIMKSLDKQGIHYKRCTRHYMVYCPEGGLVSIALTPSDHRALMNIKRDLRLRGVIV